MISKKQRLVSVFRTVSTAQWICPYQVSRVFITYITTISFNVAIFNFIFKLKYLMSSSTGGEWLGGDTHGITHFSTSRPNVRPLVCVRPTSIIYIINTRDRYAEKDTSSTVHRYNVVNDVNRMYYIQSNTTLRCHTVYTVASDSCIRYVYSVRPYLGEGQRVENKNIPSTVNRQINRTDATAAVAWTDVRNQSSAKDER